VEERPSGLLSLNPHEARTAEAIFERIFPADENAPRAKEIGVVTYVDRALSGAYRDVSRATALASRPWTGRRRDASASRSPPASRNNRTT
jgi:hypothetical protein